jgi:hypothetical protein
MASDAERAPAAPGAALVAVLCVLAFYCGAFCALDSLPYQDVPNHLSRAVAIADLLFDGGHRYGGTFSFDWQFVPYILGDAWHAVTLAVLRPSVAGRLWILVAFLSFPAATWALLAVWGARPVVRAAGAAFAIFLSADWFLRLGFLNFRYGLALALFGTVAWERLDHRRTPGRWATYLALVVACYLMHLSALVFLVAIVGTLSAVRVLEDRRVATVLRYAAAGLAPLALLGYHLAFGTGAETGAARQPAALVKLGRIGAALAPSREPADIVAALLYMLAIAAPLAWLLVRSRGRGWPRPAREAFLLAIAFFGVYLVLPEIKGEVWGVDVRALPFVWLFAALAMLLALDGGVGRGAGPWPATPVRAALGAALAVAVVHLVAIGGHLAADNAALGRYRALAARLPGGSLVLSVATWPRRGVVSPTAHAASWAVVDRAVVMPYTFAGNLDAPMTYFNFRHRPPPFPWQWWYVNHDPIVPRPQLLDGYQFLLVQQPIDWRRLPARIDLVASNDVVALLRLRGAIPDRTAEAPQGTR